MTKKDLVVQYRCSDIELAEVAARNSYGVGGYKLPASWHQPLRLKNHNLGG